MTKKSTEKESKTSKDSKKLKNSNNTSNSLESKKIREPIRKNSSKRDSFKKEFDKDKNKSKPKNKLHHSSFRYDSKKSKERSQESNNSLLKHTAILLGIIFVVLLIVFIINSNNSMSPVENEDNSSITNSNLDASDLEVIVITNPNCEFCREEQVIQDLTLLLNSSELDITTIEYSSSKAEELKEILLEEGMNFDFSPIFILSKELQLQPLFQEEPQFRNLFIETQQYFVLNPQVTQIK